MFNAKEYISLQGNDMNIAKSFTIGSVLSYGC